MDDGVIYDLITIKIKGHPEFKSIIRAGRFKRNSFFSINKALHNLSAEKEKLIKYKKDWLSRLELEDCIKVTSNSGVCTEVTKEIANTYYKKALSKIGSLRRTANTYLKECVTPDEFGWSSEEEARELILSKDYYTLIENLNLKNSDLQRAMISNYLSKKDDVLLYQFLCWYKDIYGNVL